MKIHTHSVEWSHGHELIVCNLTVDECDKIPLGKLGRDD